ncbi:hypothetical protein L2E82_32673 [Cichorium intybus]|uniref:Uncharacterized protein n=1 Tax=Cichorium intybus TaxID=13427 RepID=A0ACB9BHH5_CICIN|nr:hypothetical protein L2E82_32673 [Cichorium intybus]
MPPVVNKEIGRNIDYRLDRKRPRVRETEDDGGGEKLYQSVVVSERNVKPETRKEARIVFTNTSRHIHTSSLTFLSPKIFFQISLKSKCASRFPHLKLQKQLHQILKTPFDFTPNRTTTYL